MPGDPQGTQGLLCAASGPKESRLGFDLLPRQFQTLNRVGKGREAKLLMETSGTVVFNICRQNRGRYLPSRCGRNFEPIDKKDFADSLIFEQEVTRKSANERRSHHPDSVTD